MTEQMQVKLAEDSHLGRAGTLVTLALTPSDVHVSSELPTFLAGYSPFGFRADEVSPVVLVDKDTDQYRIFDADDAFLTLDVKGALNAAPPETQVTSALTEYTVVDRFIGSFINDVTEQNAGANYRVRQRAAKRCANAIQLDREVDVWTTLVTLASWNSANRTTLGATAKWNGGSAADPIQDLHTRIEASMAEVTDVWMGQHTANAFIRNPLVRDHMRQMIGDNAPNAALQQVNKVGASANRDFVIPGLPPVHVVSGKYRTTAGGTTSWVIGNDVVLGTRPPGVPSDGEDIATTYTFRRRGNAGVGYETREFRVEGRGPKGGTMVVVNEASIHKVTGNNCGGLIKDAYQ